MLNSLCDIVTFGAEQNRTAIICLQSKRFTIKLQPLFFSLLRVLKKGLKLTLVYNPLPSLWEGKESS